MNRIEILCLSNLKKISKTKVTHIDYINIECPSPNPKPKEIINNFIISPAKSPHPLPPFHIKHIFPSEHSKHTENPPPIPSTKVLSLKCNLLEIITKWLKHSISSIAFTSISWSITRKFSSKVTPLVLLPSYSKSKKHTSENKIVNPLYYKVNKIISHWTTTSAFPIVKPIPSGEKPFNYNSILLTLKFLSTYNLSKSWDASDQVDFLKFF